MAAPSTVTDVHDVSVLHDVVLAFHVQLRSFLEVDLCCMTRSALGAGCQQLVALHYFGADKAMGEVAVNGAGRVDGTAASADRPRA